MSWRNLAVNRNKLVISALILLAAIAAYPVWRQKSSKDNPALRVVDLELPDGVHFNADLNMPILAISPDGKKIVCSTSQGLYLCSADGSDGRFLKDTREFIAQPFFAPDGNWIGYFSYKDQRLKKIALNGGISANLAKVAVFRGAAWNGDNSIVYGTYDPSKGGRIVQISAEGKKMDTHSPPNSRIGNIYYPQLLADGRYLLFTSTIGGRSEIEVKPLASGVRKILFDGYGARYVPIGYIVYHMVDKDGVYAVPFDLAKLSLTGDPIPIVNDVWGRIQYAVSDTGTLAYIPSEDKTQALGEFRLVWVSRDGKEEPVSAKPNTYGYPRISPDGTRLALTVFSGKNREIRIWDFARQSMTGLVSGKDEIIDPLWSRDGQRIVYRSPQDDSNTDFNSKAVNGGNIEKMATLSRGGYVFTWMDGGDGFSLTPFQAKYNGEFFRVSPDGQWIAYTSDESGQNEVYVCSFPDGKRGVRQISVRGGHSPLWSPDGHELFYRDADSVIAVPVETAPVFKAGSPRALFGRQYVAMSAGRTALPMWDISPDGSRFIMMKSAMTSGQRYAGPRKIRVVHGWPEALKSRQQEK